MTRLTLFKILTGFVAFTPIVSEAHSFGKLYSLPVPFWMYLYGAIATLVISFLIIGVFYDSDSLKVIDRKISINKTLKRFTRPTITLVRIASLAIFVLIVISGLVGQNSSYTNINMTLFWICIMLGVTYASAIFGNFAEFINPWRAFVGLVGAEEWEGLIDWPKKIASYPALFFYFGLIWFELIGGSTPLLLSVVLLQYTFINVAGILVFGTRAWFKNGEFLSVFFNVVSRISPLEYRAGEVRWRGFFGRLILEKADTLGMVWFITFMLASTAFDGFKETLPWSRSFSVLSESYLRPIFGDLSYSIFQTAGLIFAGVGFFGIYFVFVWITKLIAKSSRPISELLTRFAFSLIPIALVYNVAHYFTLIFSEGPGIVRLISDPFGFGWNLFGTASIYESYVISTNIVWHVQVAMILIGHIVSVYIAHMIALSVYETRRRVLLSQVPVLILMVTYTVFGLWILSQPIINAV